jgi:hypothetical protein
VSRPSLRFIIAMLGGEILIMRRSDGRAEQVLVLHKIRITRGVGSVFLVFVSIATMPWHHITSETVAAPPPLPQNLASKGARSAA